MQAVRGNATYVAGVVMAIGGDTQGELLKEKIEKYWIEKDLFKKQGLMKYSTAKLFFHCFWGLIKPEAKAVPKIIKTPHPNIHGVTISSNHTTPMQLAKTGIR